MKFFGHMFPRETKLLLRCYLRSPHVTKDMLPQEYLIIISLSIAGEKHDHEAIYTHAPEEGQLLDKVLPTTFLPSSTRRFLQGYLTLYSLARRC